MSAAVPESANERKGWESGLPFCYGWLMVGLVALAMSGTLPGRTYGLGLIKEPLRESLGLGDLRFNILNFWAIILGAAIVPPDSPGVDPGDGVCDASSEAGRIRPLRLWKAAGTGVSHVLWLSSSVRCSSLRAGIPKTQHTRKASTARPLTGCGVCSLWRVCLPVLRRNRTILPDDRSR